MYVNQETKLREERGLSGCRKGLKALLSLKPTKTNKFVNQIVLFYGRS